MKHTWIIDAGHGGFINEEYVTAPEKMFIHNPGDHHNLAEVFYEGVFNRQVKDLLIRMLWDKGMAAVDLCPGELDVPLDVRVNIANIYEAKYENCVGISLSDKFANVLGKVLIKNFPDIRFRKGDTPGELDKDSLFYILRWTYCPWILPECLFFDNYEDYKLLRNAEFRIKYTKALVEFIMKVESQNI